ncbi:MAG: UvrD-helicase domain-containing protein [Actinomycetota bacterium]|nr:UvrD-helicase domain-containing protein [Actinomycetota bacterium]MDQ2956370.1 UvrD-helicase domain-containing protein [Actinomycetota bacterium]
MVAGSSALQQARRSELLVAEYERRLTTERARAEAFGVAGRTEAALAARLIAMDGWGWQLLADRQWPGTRANIDLIQIGPGGVLVIDVKCWAEPDIVDGRLYRGQADAEDELDKLRRVTELVTEVVAEVGLAPTEVVPVMVFMNQRATDTAIGRIKILDENSIVNWAIRRGQRLSERQVGQLVQLVGQRFPEHRVSAPTSRPAVLVPEPVLPLPRHAEIEQVALFDSAALEAAILEQAMLAPIEEWMTFLHPEQLRVVRRLSSGPSRIRGAAGTGKTVLALHRAAYLAESTQRNVLVTSFIKTLPPVLAGLYARLSPQTTQQVEFTGLHSWASQLLRARGHTFRVNPNQARTAYSRAWAMHGKNSCLAELGVPWDYWGDEIDYVIKGRGLTEFAAYAELRRIGRRTRLLPAHREIVWAIYTEYEAQLRAAGLIDFTDQLSLATAELRARPLESSYAAVIVDEVQDLNCQALRLLAELSADHLLLIGDGQQQIYPGGYTLSEAGISIAGRSAVLRTNYRNAADIIAAAAEVVAADGYNDLDGTNESGQREVVAARERGRVYHVEAFSPDELRRHALEHLAGLIAAGREPAGIAILCATNDEVDCYQKLLANKAIPSVKLTAYTGVAVAAVKVGTYARAKGLEFKDVLVIVHAKPAGRNDSPELRQEQRERDNRTLFVAMTRARDSLWLGRLNGPPRR